MPARPLTDDEVRQRLAALDEFKKTATGIAVWDLVQNVSGGLHGGLDDWPSHMRDAVYRAIEMDCKPRPGWHVKVVASGCFQDDPRDPCYVRVIVQEFPPIVRH